MLLSKELAWSIAQMYRPDVGPLLDLVHCFGDEFIERWQVCKLGHISLPDSSSRPDGSRASLKLCSAYPGLTANGLCPQPVVDLRDYPAVLAAIKLARHTAGDVVRLLTDLGAWQ